MLESGTQFKKKHLIESRSLLLIKIENLQSFNVLYD